MKTLLQYAHNVQSDNGEDGIIAELCKRLGIKAGWFVEFGASDGIRVSNTYELLKAGWKGVDIEGDSSAFEELKITASKYPKQLTAIQAFVADEGKNSLDVLLKPTALPKDFDVLSIDIDSHDWWIWKALRNYTPKIVVIEINSSMPPGKRYVQPKEEGETGASGTGSSFTSMLELGQEKGYTLVCHTGNMIFVRNDLVPMLNLPAEELANPDALFRYELIPFKPTFANRLRRKLNYMFSGINQDYQ